MLGFLKFGKGAQGANLNMPLKDARFVVLDTELTGLDEKRDSIVSIGAIRITNGRIDLGETFYKMAKPGSELTRDSVVIHGITPSDVSGQPALEEVLMEFFRFCGGDTLVGHCLSIDLAFLNRHYKKALGSPLANPAVDSYMVHEWLAGRVPAYQESMGPCKKPDLYELAGRLGVLTRGAHNAEMDAFVTAQLFQRYIPILAEAGVTTVGELVRLADPFKGGDRFRTASQMQL
ncbi:MAG TPA: 3'-5' exonuclease [Nitrospirota bacterium]|jgi:DNA polymerase-3 subunit epsilon